MIKRLALAAAFALCISPCVCAAETIDIKKALEITLRDNISLLSLKQEIVKAYGVKIRADGALLPQVTINANANKQRTPQTNDGSDRSDSESAAVTLEETLYSGGKIMAGIAQSDQVKNMAELELRYGEKQTAGDLYGYFYSVILRKKQIEAEEAAIATSEHHVKQVKKMIELGLANRLEMIRASQQLAQNKSDLAVAKALYETSVIALKNYMSLEPSAAIAVDGNLYEPVVSGDAQNSTRLAMARRDDAEKLRETIKYQTNQIKIERSALLPKVTAGVTTGPTTPYQQKDRTEDTWRAEIAFSMPIFDRNAARSAIINAEAVQAQNKLSLRQKELDIKSDVENAWSNIRRAREAMDAQREALAFAKETLRLAEAGFREGVTPQFDLLDAQSKLTDAQLSYNTAQYACIMAAVELKLTEGTILEWDGDVK
ncbi:MAG: TolC family protein [Synergistes sp.]|nr:TolC family protein [Synergistes sp.]